MPNRSIIIGDVHGCARELNILLEELQIDATDEVIFVGDLINKGPDSHAVFDLMRSVRGRATLGNHEHRILRYRQTGDPKYLKSGDTQTIASLTESDWAIIKNMPLTIELPEYRAVVVHGGFLPGIPWRLQEANIVTRIQVIDDYGQPAKRSQCPKGTPWADRWTGPEYVIYGHTPRREIFRRPHSIGLDTGCVYGGKLSALVLPERRLHTVPADRSYTKKAL